MISLLELLLQLTSTLLVMFAPIVLILIFILIFIDIRTFIKKFIKHR